MGLSLGAKQEIFAGLLPQLIVRAYELGFRVRLQELKRGKQQAEWNATHCGKCGATDTSHAIACAHPFRPIGIANSLHCDGLALDLVLFRGGRPLWATERYRDLGEYWEGLHELCRWGGRFRDGGHFSITHGGRQ